MTLGCPRRARAHRNVAQDHLLEFLHEIRIGGGVHEQHALRDAFRAEIEGTERLHVDEARCAKWCILARSQRLEELVACPRHAPQKLLHARVA
jgi:hypothetical protein